jgi:RHS repeat-associated protein
VFSWLLERIEDVHGNWIQLSHCNKVGGGTGDCTSGQTAIGVTYLQELTYGYQGAPLSGQRRIVFELDATPRPDAAIDYSAGFLQRTDRRVKNIRVQASGENDPNIARYELGYDQSPDSNRTLLASVQLFGRAGQQIWGQPYDFQYQEHQHSFSLESVDLTPQNPPGNPRILTRSSDRITGWITELNGDGLVDFVAGSSPAQWYRSRGDTLGPSEPVTGAGEIAQLCEQVHSSCRRETSCIFSDLDGDGWQDSVAERESTNEWGVRRGFSGGLSSESNHPVPLLTTNCGSCCPETESGIQVTSGGTGGNSDVLVDLIDLNGDGRPDRILKPTTSGPIKVHYNVSDRLESDLFLNTGTDWADPGAGALTRIGSLQTTAALMDMNADGLVDRVYFSIGPPSGMRVAFNTGAGFDPPVLFATGSALREANFHPFGGTFTIVDSVDMNGDGFPDTFYSSSVKFGTGTSYLESVPWAGGPSSFIRGLNGLFDDRDLVDINGDGLVDMLMSVSNNESLYLNSGPHPDLLEVATTPFGARATLTYDSSARMRDDFGEPGNPNVPFSRPVVVGISRWDGRPSTPHVVDEFEYRDGFFDREEREFRGFATVLRRSLGVGGAVVLEDESHYDTTRECAGMMTSRETCSGLCTGASVLARETRSSPADPNHEFFTVRRGPAAEPDPTQQWAACLLDTITSESVEGQEASKKVRESRRFYGSNPHFNVEHIEDWTIADADQGVTAPRKERTLIFEYAAPDDPDHPEIVSHVSQLRIESGSDPPQLAAARRMFYDDQAAGLVQRGILTHVDGWLAHPPQDPVQEDPNWVAQRSIGYDDHGNPALVRGPPTASDPTGFSRTTTYDETYRAFPVRVRRGADPGDLGVDTAVQYDCPGLSDPNRPPGSGLPCAVTEWLDPSQLPGEPAPTTWYRYDAAGRVKQVDHHGGLVETRTYTLPGPGAAETILTRQLQLLTPEPSTLTFKSFLDGFGREFREESPGLASEIIVVERAYDQRGRLWTETIPHFSGAPAPALRTFTYDGAGRLSVMADFDGETHLRRSYAPWSVVEEVFFEPPGPSSQHQKKQAHLFDALGRLILVRDYLAGSNYRQTRAIYDATGNLVEVSDPLKNDYFQCNTWKINYGWNAGEQAICPTAPVGNLNPTGLYPVTKIVYDTLGRRVWMDDVDAGILTYEFDDAGLLVKQTRPGSALSWIAFEYDGLRRPVAQTVWPQGSGSADVAFEYGTDYADWGRLVGVRATSGDPNTSYEYWLDELGRLWKEIQTTDGLVFENRYEQYDELGRPHLRTFPDGLDFRYDYDGLRLTGIYSQPGEYDGFYQGWVFQQPTYDALGRLTALGIGDVSGASNTEAPVGLLEWEYDPTSGRLSSMKGSKYGGTSPIQLWDLAYQVDGLGRLLSRSGLYMGESLVESFAYDKLGRLVTAYGPWEQPQGNPDPVTWTFQYDPLGNLYRQLSSNGGATSYTRWWKQTDYENPRFLTSFETWQGGAPALSESIQPDLAGRVASRAPSAGPAASFSWSPQNRPFQIQAAEISTRHYDAFGQLAVEQIGAAKIIHVGSDFEYHVADSSGAAPELANKFIVAEGLRVATLASYYVPDSAFYHQWAWLLRPLGAAGALAGAGLVLGGLAGLAALGFRPRRRWVAVPGVGVLCSFLVLLPTRAWSGGGGGTGGPGEDGSHGELFLGYLPDHLGSTRAVVDMWGNLVETRDYDPFGRTIGHTGDFALKHRFTGQPEREAAGVYDYGARLYEPDWGRFLSPDSYVQGFDSQGLHRYAYVLNQPTSLVDPTGNFVGGAGDGGLGAAIGVASGLGSLGGLDQIGGGAGGGRTAANSGTLRFAVSLILGRYADYERLRPAIEVLTKLLALLRRDLRKRCFQGGGCVFSPEDLVFAEGLEALGRVVSKRIRVEGGRPPTPLPTQPRIDGGIEPLVEGQEGDPFEIPPGRTGQVTVNADRVILIEAHPMESPDLYGPPATQIESTVKHIDRGEFGPFKNEVTPAGVERALSVGDVPIGSPQPFKVYIINRGAFPVLVRVDGGSSL